jgi:hypothetical protein
MADICSGVVLGVKRDESEGDPWIWRGESYSVKKAYHVLVEEEEDEYDWVGYVWNKLIPSNMLILV